MVLYLVCCTVSTFEGVSVCGIVNGLLQTFSVFLVNLLVGSHRIKNIKLDWSHF